MNHKLILTAVSAFALGLAVQSLHAQMTPPAYVVAMNDVKDEAGYKNEFLPPVLKAIADHGGKYVAGGFNKTTTLNGAPPPNRVVIVQFESMAKVKAWWDSDEQKAATKIGEKYATLNTFAVEGAMPK
jgi:uncharacterized protein (DUF1330 family)